MDRGLRSGRRTTPLALETSVEAPPLWNFSLRALMLLSVSDCFQSSLCFSESITTMEWRTARTNSSGRAPLIVISVIRLDTIPIWRCFISGEIKRLSLGLMSFGKAYDSLGSNPWSPFNGAAFLIWPLLFGITCTVSPSKSAPDRRSATLELMPTASLALPMYLRPSLFRLFTTSSGISNRPACG